MHCSNMSRRSTSRIRITAHCRTITASLPVSSRRSDAIAEACEQYQISLTHALRQEPGRNEVLLWPSLDTAWAEQLLKMKQPQRALHVVAQGVGLAGDQEWLLRVVEARALWDLAGNRSRNDPQNLPCSTPRPK